MTTLAYETIWYPGVYTPMWRGDYGRFVADVPIEEIVTLVKQRAERDGEWAIQNDLIPDGLAGDDENKMRRMMAWMSREENIRQCVQHVFSEKQELNRTVDWVCRDLAKAARFTVK